MIAVSVCPDGSLNSATCRWNHDYGATDSQFDAIELSKLIQKNFFRVFKPKENTKDSKYTEIAYSLIRHNIKEPFPAGVRYARLKNMKNAAFVFVEDEENSKMNIVAIKKDLIIKCLFPEWLPFNASLVSKFDNECYGAYNNEHDYEIYSAITTNKVFGPYPSVKTFGGDLFVNIDNTISYFINITDSNKCKEVRSKWKLTNSETEDLNQVSYVKANDQKIITILKFTDKSKIFYKILLTKTLDNLIPEFVVSTYQVSEDNKTLDFLTNDAKHYRADISKILSGVSDKLTYEEV